MTVQEVDNSLITNEIVFTKPGWETRLARLISHVGSPPVWIVSMMLLAASVVNAVMWGDTAVYLTLILLIPLAYVAYLVQQGKATDFDVSVRRQRVIPMFVSLAGSVAGLLYFAVVSAPRLLIMLAVANLISTFVIAVVTVFWKISVHSATSAAGAVLFWGLLGTPVFFLAVPLIMWSRVKLGRHTLTQTLAGVLLGISVLGLTFLFGNL
ncbi:MAG: phosphatase PAP2 family protein [Ardenticatenaceae bacterium]|nr:phosphatase PAP2 family protein [Ardenticatenaceae bacterium]MCB9443752.1 phosphatase PAP2 family protein [Ardenticatenaceae bacterium]